MAWVSPGSEPGAACRDPCQAASPQRRGSLALGAGGGPGGSEAPAPTRPVAVGLNPDQGGLMGRFLAGIAEGVVQHLRQPLAEGGQPPGGTGMDQGGVGGIAGGCRNLSHGLMRVGPISMGRMSGIGNR